LEINFEKLKAFALGEKEMSSLKGSEEHYVYINGIGIGFKDSETTNPHSFN
jgi:hypothetical protein